MTDVEAQWKGRSDFAEVAEAIGTTTEHIMAVMPRPGGVVFAMYSEGLDADDLSTPIYSVALKRDRAGVLTVVGREQVGTFGTMRETIEGGLRDQFGDPPDPR